MSIVDAFIKNIHNMNETDTLIFMEELNNHIEKNNFNHLVDKVFGITDEAQEQINEAEEKVERWEDRAEEATRLLNQLKQLLA